MPELEPPPTPEPEPEPVPLALPPPRRRPASPWIERPAPAHPWRLPLIVTGVVLLVALALWYVELRPRASAIDVEQHVGLTHPGSTITCRPRGHNAARFDCAVIYAAESQCVTVSVSLMGTVSAGRLMPSRCTAPQLKALLPRPTPQLVSADVTRIVGGTRFLCAHAGPGDGRFACARVTAAGVDCRIARVVAWSPLHPRPGGAKCRQVPTLRQTVLG